MTRIDITAKFTNTELDQLCHQAGLYYHHSSPWLNNKLIAKRRNLWLCLREIINRYPDHARSTTNFIYLPKINQKQRWLEFARGIGLENLAQKIITEEDLSLFTRFSAKACENIFWKNYWIKFQIIQAMPRIDKYFNENEEHILISADDLKFKPIKIHSVKELRDHYLEPKNKTPFPSDRFDLYPFLPKIGLTSIKHETSKIPKLAILQWALETVVVFYDNPYIYKIDPASHRRLEDCIYNRLPLLSSIINQTKLPLLQNKELDDKIIQEHYILAEQLLRHAMQLNNLLP